MINNEKTVAKKILYDGKVVKLEIIDVDLGNGKNSVREIIRHQGGVGILPLTDDNHIYLITQFRKAYDKAVLEIPAGKLEKNELTENCAIRELKEETGITAGKIQLLTKMYPSTGYSDEIITIYLAENLEMGDTCPDEDEFIEIHKMSLQKAFDMVKTGEICDAKTIIAILMTANMKNIC